MNLPPPSPDDAPHERRAVPRHIRDGEHDMWRDGLGESPAAPDGALRRRRLWLYFAVILASGAGLFYYLGFGE